MPDHVIGKTEDAVARPLGHFGKAFCFGLVFEGVAGEVDACDASQNNSFLWSSRDDMAYLTDAHPL